MVQNPFLIFSTNILMLTNDLLAKVVLISDFLEISNVLKLIGLLVTIDIQKAFNFVDHSFLISTLERYEFGNRFIKRLNILLKNKNLP